jgi:cytochrome c biogenesis protein CcdA
VHPPKRVRSRCKQRHATGLLRLPGRTACVESPAMNLEVLPLAITMMAGPQIMSAIIFVTSKNAVRLSLAFIAGVAIGVTLGVVIAKGIVSLLGISLGDSSDSSSAGTIIQIALVLLLLAAAVRNYVKRATIEPPKWLGALMEAEPGKAFVLGLALITVFPSDALILLTVGTNLEQTSASLVDALPFIGATILIAALPFLFYLLFHRRAVEAMPKVRDWMNKNSWLVNIIVCGIFIALIL